MNCELALTLIDSYLDNQLDLTAALNFEEHLVTCGQCQNELSKARQLQNIIQQHLTYHYSPDSLRVKLEMLAKTRVKKDERPSWRQLAWHKWFAPRLLATCTLLLLATNVSLYWIQPSRLNRLSEEIVSSHVRSLMADHMTDVASSDQHTVKPWFNGKLDFSPTVIDLTEKGFTLLGGRLDYIDSNPVAALIYRRRQHLINVFIWPENIGSPQVGYNETRNGYNLVSFKTRSMNYWIVSDLNLKELESLKLLLQMN